ncbi:MAG: exo-beta-N-acetylmuramidase NamZ family protein [Flavipsychrobacter sp.]
MKFNIAYPQEIDPNNKTNVICGAERIKSYVKELQHKRVAVVINQSARVGDALLVDTLVHLKINVVKIFVPEHGLRGQADAGATINNGIDSATGLPVISLYGNNKKPKTEQLADVDIVVYDLQDVGVRFYTYISTLQYVMEACAEQNKRLIILDRPDPNGFYVDGPILDTSLRSFVGMQPIPVVYGMTAGEYAKMLIGKRWFKDAAKLNLTVIPCLHYDHTKKYALRYPPSPNLKTMAAVYLYPSLCFFEGTVVSVGRGTDFPFQQWGHPAFIGKADYSFTPEPNVGSSKPPYEGKACYGKFVAHNKAEALAAINGQLSLEWLIQAYSWYPEKDKFFNKFFESLAGSKTLRTDIEQGKSATEIRVSWLKDLRYFKAIRKKYLLYPDFE